MGVPDPEVSREVPEAEGSQQAANLHRGCEGPGLLAGGGGVPSHQRGCRERPGISTEPHEEAAAGG